MAGGAYGIVSATATNGSATATTTASLSATSELPDRAGSNARSGPIAGEHRARSPARHVQLHTHDLGGPEGDHRRGAHYEIPERDKLDLAERYFPYSRRSRVLSCSPVAVLVASRVWWAGLDANQRLED